MKRKEFVLIGLVFLLFLGIGVTAEAATVRFPVEVSIDSGAHYLTDTEIFVLNLKSKSVTISFGYYGNNGTKGSCPIPASITIEGNDSWSFRVGGCFAVATPMPAVNLVGIGEISAASKTVSVYWRIYDVWGDKDILMDHGKESP